MRGKKSYILSLLALVLILCAFIQPAWAYFTSSKEADGAVQLNFKRTTTITETVDQNMTKHVTITNTGDCEVLVRARAYAGEQYGLDVTLSSGWRDGEDGWYYYDIPLKTVDPGKSTTELLVKLDLKGIEPTDVANVGVIYQCTTVIYDSDGKPTADWSPDLIPYTGSTSPTPNS